ncbi:MAG: methyltransferase domain-containing protein [Candidatus Margulisiibacteriota bacterium]
MQYKIILMSSGDKNPCNIAKTSRFQLLCANSPISPNIVIKMDQKETNHFFDKAFWSVYSYIYDVMEKLLPYQQLLNDMEEACAVNSDANTLEIGIGTLNFTKKILPKVKKLYGVDFSDAFINKGIKKVNEKEKEKLEIEILDLNNHREVQEYFNRHKIEGGFNLICGNLVFYTLQNGEVLLSVFKENLNTGGKIVLSNIRPWFSPRDNLKAHIQMKAAVFNKSYGHIVGWCAAILNLLSLAPRLIGVGILNVILTGRADYTKYTDNELKAMAKRVGLKISIRPDSYAGSTSIIILEPEAE